MKPNKIFIRIILHLGGWILLFLLPPLILQTPVELPDSFVEIMNWVFVIVFFYINYIWLIPHYLSKRKFIKYFAGIILMLTTCYFSNEIYYAQRHKVQMIDRGESIDSRTDTHRKPRRFRSYFSTLFCFAVLAVGTSIKVTEGWYQNEKLKKDMENQKLGAELSLLKSQINPHFFFNTLNSIYSLAIIKSDKTPEAVVKLSELMRYIIYETERKLVPLSKEVEYIANYIELQRLRLPEEIKVSLKAELGNDDAVIEPLLLLPFVENAFKHGVDIEKGGKISITIKRIGNELRLIVQNPLVDNNINDKEVQSGIGMINTLKRLQLLYQDNYTFTAGPVNENYVVSLVLKLKENEVSDS
jgi:two-component system LytT family sensor kinase